MMPTAMWYKPAAGATRGTISTGCSPRLQQFHDNVRVRPKRCARAADIDHVNDVLPQQVLLARKHDGGWCLYATSTNYLWLGDTLLATVDRKLYNGTATGTPITRYIHPDHLGSTNVVTDASGTVAQLLDYYPYGASRIATSTYPTNEKRQYIGQFADTQSSLDYLNARYYDGARDSLFQRTPHSWAIQLIKIYVIRKA